VIEKIHADAVRYTDQVVADGLKRREAGRLLGISARTLRRWEASAEGNVGFSCPPRGRAMHRSPVEFRNLVAWGLVLFGTELTLRGFLTLFEGMPRSELMEIHDRYQRFHHHLEPLWAHTLSWSTPGTVWAMDHAVPPQAVDGVFPNLFALRDLSSGLTLRWEPAVAASAQQVIASLEDAFCLWGAPLVIKCDNGPAFISEALEQFLEPWGVKLLLSPVRRPQYNGSAEAAIRWLKRRSEREATRAGRPGAWRHEDMERAALLSNELPRRGSPSPQSRWEARTALAPERRLAFLQTVKEERPRVLQELGLEGRGELPVLDERKVERHSIRRALVAHGLLSFRRRIIPLQQKFQKADMQ
jgi:transposase InsO family protein